MKKLFLLLISSVFAFLVSAGCSTPTTVEGALKRVNIETSKIYAADKFNNIIVAFYKDKKTGHQTAGLFIQENGRISFIIQNDLELNNSLDSALTMEAYLTNRTDKLPEFTFQYGIINNPQIINVKLHMNDYKFEDRYAKIIEINGLRIWYTVIDTKRIYNIFMGISKDGNAIYSNVS